MKMRRTQLYSLSNKRYIVRFITSILMLGINIQHSYCISLLEMVTFCI